MDRPNSRPNTRSGGDQTPDRTAFAIAEAAERLGLSSEAVRMRLKRGTLDGAKIDGHWIVYLSATEHRPNTDRTPTEQVSEHPPEHDRTTVQATYETLVSTQREEIAFLRGQLDHSRRELSQERERFDVIHREALARIEAITAPDRGQDAPGGAEAVPTAPDTPPSIVASWVRRLLGRGRP